MKTISKLCGAGLLFAMAAACNHVKFTGDAERAEGERTNPEVPATTKPDPTVPGTNEDKDPPPSTYIPPDDDGTEGQPLTIDPIGPQAVNTGDVSNRYSELLQVPITWKGGTGGITITSTTNSGSPKAGLKGASFEWRPGIYTSGSYNNEVGKQQVTITLKDDAGESVSTSFTVDIVPVKWKSKVIDTTNDDLMKVEYTITESLHSDRKYKQKATMNGQNLGSASCSNFVSGEAGLQLTQGPTFTDMQASSKVGGDNQHKLSFTMVQPIAAQPYDNTVYVTWLNLVAVDGGIEKPESEGIFIYYAYSRCRDDSLSEKDCKKAALSSNSMKNFYYCSDLMAAGSNRETELKKLYCGFAKLNGVTVSGCP